MTPEEQIALDQRVQALWINAPTITHAQMCQLESDGLTRGHSFAREVANPDDRCVPVVVSDRDNAGFYLHSASDAAAVRSRLAPTTNTPDFTRDLGGVRRWMPT